MLNQYQYTSRVVNFIRLHLIKMMFVLMIVLGGLWLSNNAMLEISVEDGAKNYEYEIRNQSSTKLIKVSSSNPSKKIRVNRGSYEVTVRSNDKNFFAVVKSKSFLMTTRIAGKLESEKSLEFIGGNPAPCTLYIEGVLYSYECNNVEFLNVYQHTPASKTSPTYKTLIGNTGASGEERAKKIESIFSTKEGTFALLKSSFRADDNQSTHILYKLQNGLVLGKDIALLGLEADKIYSAKPYRDGFIVFEETSNDVFYYASGSAKPEKITIPSPKNKDATILSIYTDTDTLLSVHQSPVDESGHQEGKSPKAVTELDILSGKSNRHFSFKQDYESVRLCPHLTVCMIDYDRMLNIYDLSTSKPRLKFRISGVSSVEEFGQSKVIAIKKEHVLVVDPGNAQGHIDFTFDKNTFNYISIVDDQSYILNILDSKQKGQAVLINRSRPTDSIDQKITELKKSTYISDLSIYKKVIWVSPNVGDPEYDSSIGSFDYDRTRVAAANDAINILVRNIGINTQVYSIISSK